MLRIPSLAYFKVSNLLGSENMKKNANLLLKVIKFINSEKKYKL